MLAAFLVRSEQTIGRSFLANRWVQINKQCLPSATHYRELSKSSICLRKQDVPQEYEGMKFTSFYRFRYIVPVRALSRLKLYQTGLTVLVLPPVTYLYATGVLDPGVLQMCYGLASFAGSMLFIMSHYFRRLVGIMALSDNEEIVRVSRLTFWGNRKEIYLNKDSIIPLSDMADRPNDVYVKLQTYDSEEYLYWTLKYGGILDMGKFTKVFGIINPR